MYIIRVVVFISCDCIGTLQGCIKHVCCSVLWCVAACCSVLQCVAECCTVIREGTIPRSGTTATQLQHIHETGRPTIAL